MLTRSSFTLNYRIDINRLKRLPPLPPFDESKNYPDGMIFMRDTADNF